MATNQPAATDLPPPGPGDRRLPWWRRRSVRALLTLAVLAFGAALLALRWETYGPVMADVDPVWMAVAVVLLIAGNVTSTYLSAELLAARGTAVAPSQMARVVLTSNVAKYVPGFVAQMATYYQMARAIGVDRRGVLLLWVESTWLTVTVTAAMGAAALLVVDSAVPLWVAALILCGCAVSLVPRVRDGLLAVARLLPAGQERLGGLNLRALLIAVVGVGFLGAHGVALARGVGASDLTLVQAIAAFAGGWVVGLLAFVFPGGIGPRELVASALLADFTSPSVAVVLVVLSRLATILADVIAGAAAMLLRSPNQSSRSGPVALGESATAQASGG